MRALMELLTALRGTISVALQRSRPRAVVVGVAVVALALVLGGLVLVPRGSDDQAADDLAGPGGGVSGTTDAGDRAVTDPEVAADGRPLVDGVATRSTAGAGSGGGANGDAAPTEDGGSPEGADADRDAGGTPLGGSPAPSPAPDLAPPDSTSTSSPTVAPGSSTTTEGSTTTTTAPSGGSSGGGLLTPLLELLGLG